MINYVIDNQQTNNQVNIILEDDEEAPEQTAATENRSQSTFNQIYQIVNIIFGSHRNQTH
jgi:hypothetical protein